MQRIVGTILAIIVTCCSIGVHAYEFSLSLLNNENVFKPTSLQFGPDGRLYVSEQFGKIRAYTIVRNGLDDYEVVDSELIADVRWIPNHDDDGSLNTSENTRQVTGLLVTGTSTFPIIYVTSSDPRIGAGAGGQGDLNLDTNSGIISRLVWDGVDWNKVDLVRGLPRSEENHASNGLQLDTTTNTLYVAQGGNTNGGGPSTNFAFSTEYAYAAAILAVDLDALDAMPIQGSPGDEYIYDMPTLDDPDRTNAGGQDQNDPWGGNDGLNQAKIVPGGPVQIHASGLRNPYDVILMQSPGQEGRMYTFDNAGNEGWGGYPHNEGPAGNCTNEYINESGFMNNEDGLHYVTGPGYYGGHPAPIRGNPGGAGLFRYDENASPGQEEVFELSPTVDWPPVPVGMADPVQCDFLLPGSASSPALMTVNHSTNGLAEYTAPLFNNELQGNLLAASYDGSLLRVELSPDGTQVVNSEYMATNIGSIPLDVTTPQPSDGSGFEGTIWVALYGESKIAILEPGEGNCTGADDPLLDEDGDGFSNSDEIANGTDPCSGASRPADADGDNVSDLLDTDDDNDNLADTQDPYPIDPINGFDVVAPMEYDLFNVTSVGFFGVGFTGVMHVPGTDYADLLDTDNVIAGGTAGLFTIANVGSGTPVGASNSLENGFQYGVYLDATSVPQVVSSKLAGPFFAGAPAGGQFQGIYIGTGDQDNYLAINIHADNGTGGIQILHEDAGSVIENTVYSIPAVLGAISLELFLVIDPADGTVQPRYAIEGSGTVDVGTPVILQGALLDMVRAQKPIAVGLMAGNAGQSPFAATWDKFNVDPVLATTGALVVIDPPGVSINGSTYNSGSFQLTNQSTSGEIITRVELDLSTSLLPDLVYDPDGTAGDAASKGFTVDSDPGTGLLGFSYTEPNNGVDGDDGYNSLVIDFDDFDAGETFTFSIDNDPTSIKGANNPGPNDSGSVAGQELSGATAIIEFDDGSTRQARTFYVENSINRSEVTIQDFSPSAPSLSVGGLANPAMTSDPSHTVTIAGPAGASGQLYIFEAGLYTAGVPGGGYDIDPFEANSVIAWQEMSFVIGGSGTVDVPVVLTKSESAGGYNYITAALRDGSSDVFGPPATHLLQYDGSTGGGGSATYRINAGGPDYTDSNGDLWSADSFFNTGGVSTSTISIAGTSDPALYQNARWDSSSAPELMYTLPVPNGTYTVRLHFSENNSNNAQVGARFFDVEIEGTTVLPDYDIFADAGFATAAIQEISSVAVSDGNLNIEFLRGAKAPRVAAIEVLSDSSPPDDPNISATPSSLNFGGIVAGSGSQQVAAINNTGTATLNVSTLTIVGDSAFTVVSPTGGFTVPPGGGQDVTIAFNPPTTGAFNATLQVASDDPDQPQLNISLSGQGTSGGGGSSAVYRINSGGPDYTDGSGNLWSADNFFNAGSLTSTDETISGTGDPALYETGRWDGSGPPELIYDFPVSNGTYTVRLHFVETKFIEAGKREFDVDLEGATVLDNYDIFADAGFAVATVQELNGVVVSDGSLTVEFTRIIKAPRISAIEILDEAPPSGPDIGANPSSLNFGTVETGTGSQLVVTLTNSGSDALQVSSTGISGDTEFTVVSPAGAFSIPQGGNQDVTVAFDPATDGAFSATLQVNSDDPDEPQLDIALSGEGASGGSIAASPTALDFGSVPSGSGSQQVVTLSNSGISTLQVSNIGISGDTEFTLVSPTGAFSIPPGGDQDVTIAFDPAADGPYSGTLQVDSDDPNQPQLDIGLSGQGTSSGPALYRINSGGPDYTDGSGNLWSADNFFNAGSLTSTDETISGTGDPALYETGRWDGSGPPELIYDFPVSNGTYTVRLHFVETKFIEAGKREFDVDLEGATVLDNYDIFADAGFAVATVQELNGVVVSDGSLTIEFTRIIKAPRISAIEILSDSPPVGPNIVANPTTLNFGGVEAGTGSQLAVNLSNTGTEILQVSALAISGDTEFTVVSPVGPFSILQGADQDVTVAFDPAVTGPFSGTLQITSDDPDQPQLDINLSGQGTSGSSSAVYRINSGGPDYTDTASNLWSADNFFNAGATTSTSEAVSGTSDPALYQTARWDSSGAPELLYDFPISNGTYTVRLHFVEIRYTEVGKRVFDVDIEGSPALNDYDIYADVGFGVASVKEFANVVVSDGNLDIDFTRIYKAPKISAIEILQ